MTRDELEALTRKHVQLVLGLDNPPGPDDDLEKQHGADSLDLLGIVVELETELKIEIPDDVLDQFQTVKGMVDVLEALVRERDEER